MNSLSPKPLAQQPAPAHKPPSTTVVPEEEALADRAVVIAADRLIVSSYQPVVPDAAVLVRGGKITGVGRREDFEHIDVDLGDRTLSAGMIDAHVHLPKWPEGGGPLPHLQTVEQQLVQTVRNAQRLLANGVTAVRDLGSAGTVVSTVREAVSSGAFHGPRIETSNEVITITGGHGFAFGKECDNEHEIRKAVRGHVRQGADWVKMMASGGFSNPYHSEQETPFAPLFSPQEMKTMVDEAHRFGLPVAAHCQAKEAIAAAFEAGVDTIEHASFAAKPMAKVDQDLARAIAEGGVPVVPTTNNYWLEQGVPWAPLDVAIKNVGILFDCGITLIAGTDMGLPTTTPQTYAQGLEVLALAGVPLPDIHAAATENAAAAMKWTDCGRVAEGLRADLVAFEGNPLEDIYSYARVDWVMAHGVPCAVRPDRAPASPAPPPAGWSGVFLFGDGDSAQ